MLSPYPNIAREEPENLAFEVHSIYAVGYAIEVAVCFYFPKSKRGKEKGVLKYNLSL